MKISGIIPLRNVVQLGYPFELAIRSLRPLCDEVVALVDPSSDDDTVARVRALCPDVLIESVWNRSNHDGKNSEIARQTGIACEAATGDWILSLQADEMLHEREVDLTIAAVEHANQIGVTALDMVRWYFFGSLDKYRDNWTVPLPRLFQKDSWRPDPESGAMYFVPKVPGAQKTACGAGIYHYSRVGDPASIARRVRNLDTFYHAVDAVAPAADVPDYTFDLRKLDTYVHGHQTETDETAQLLPFALDRHPAAALEHFHVVP